MMYICYTELETQEHITYIEGNVKEEWGIWAAREIEAYF